MSDPIDILVPEFGHGLTEALVIEWLVSVGDTVDRGDVIVVLETDKSSFELVAEKSGTITEILGAARSIITSGAVLYKLDELVRPFVHKILVVIEPLLIDEDYYARVEGREIIANLSKVSPRPPPAQATSLLRLHSLWSARTVPLIWKACLYRGPQVSRRCRLTCSPFCSAKFSPHAVQDDGAAHFLKCNTMEARIFTCG